MQPDAELRVPAETAYVAVLRMTTAGIAARLDFTLDDIEDLRIAVGEACAMVLAGAAPDGSMGADFACSDGALTVQVWADAPEPAEPDHDSFAWQVLSALTSTLESGHTGHRQFVTLAVAPTTDG